MRGGGCGCGAQGAVASEAGAGERARLTSGGSPPMRLARLRAVTSRPGTIVHAPRVLLPLFAAQLVQQ